MTTQATRPSAPHSKPWLWTVVLVTACALCLGLSGCDDDSGQESRDTDSTVDTNDDDATVDSDIAGDTADDGSDVQDGDIDPPGPTTAYFELHGEYAGRSEFFTFPWPSDLRLREDGTTSIDDLGNPRNVELVAGIIEAAGQQRGFPVIPVGWFRFDAEMPEMVETDVIPADPSSHLMLIDVDPDSPEQGRLFPTVGRTLAVDTYTPPWVIGVAPRQGIVLRPDTQYAFVVRRELGDADGEMLGVPDELVALREGLTPEGALGPDAVLHYATLWTVLDDLGVPRDSVAAATIFTTGDVVRELHELSEAVRAEYDIGIDDLTLDVVNERYCQLGGTMTLPQFQVGTPSFDEEGLFEMGPDGLPIKQRDATIPVVITVPRVEMPSAGYPLSFYYHGSGGISTQLVDRGPIPSPGAGEIPGEGPAYVVAEHGIAMAGSAHPVNPERVPGAISTEYLNINNPKALRDTFRQGAIEQRLYLDALLELRMPPSLFDGCDGVALPAGETEFFFSPDRIMATGQSMGGMYTNIIGAIEPRIKAVVPTGAGGFWSYFITVTSLLEALPALELLTQAEDLNFMHPVLAAVQVAYEPAEPMVYMPRLARRPLPGHPVRPIYEPVGKGDSFFPVVLYDAIALAYCHEQAGDIVWPEMQEALALLDRDGIIEYPVDQNLMSDDGTPYTGVVVQYEGDGFSDPHSIYMQLEDVRYQWGCFFRTFLETGTATVPAPATLGTPCPGLP